MAKESVFKRFLRNKDGNMAIMTVASILTLILTVSLSVDSTNLFQKRNTLQSMSDSIALAAFQSGETDAAALRKIADDYMTYKYDSQTVANIQIDTIQHNGSEVLVSLSQTPNQSSLFLAQNNYEIGVSSTAGNGDSALNLALVLDSTGSMGHQGKMPTLKRAANDMIDKLEDSSSQDIKISVVPFAQYVNVGTGNSFASWIDFPNQQHASNWSGCVGSRVSGFEFQVEAGGNQIPAFSNIHCGQALQPLTANMSAVRSKVNSLTPSGWTYLPAGLMWGWRTLDGQAPFTQAAASKPDQQIQNVMIFMTDGENTRAKNGQYHQRAAISGFHRNAHEQVNQDTSTVCEAIKSDEVIVYTIAFRVNDANTRNLLEGCASSQSHYFDASNNNKLIEAFNAIADEVGNLRLTN